MRHRFHPRDALQEFKNFEKMEISVEKSLLGGTTRWLGGANEVIFWSLGALDGLDSLLIKWILDENNQVLIP